MKIGENLGEILLNICQEKIKNSDNPREALSIYTDSLIDFPEEKIIDILKGNVVLNVDVENQVMVLSDKPEDLETNKEHLYDWDLIIQDRLDDLNLCRDKRLKVRENFQKDSGGVPIDNYSLHGISNFAVNGCEGLCQLAAKLIAGIKLSDCSALEEDVWADIAYRVLYSDGEESEMHERCLYWTVKYVECIKELHQAYLKFIQLYSWLNEVGLLKEKPDLIESSMESVIDILLNFADKNKKYNSPLCDAEVAEYKDSLYKDVSNTVFGKDYIENGVLEKNLLDGTTFNLYEAGWLSPEGEFYGMVRGSSQLIHLEVATALYNNGTGKLGSQMKADGVGISSVNSPERWLEKKGWIKIHDDSIYGSFSIYETEEEDSMFQYCPTEKQVEEICKFANKFYGGKFYTEYPTFGTRTMRPDPVHTYKLRQMDKPMLHKTFSF